MHVIGTAGHVDHGKSSLIAALTGINPDRLKEEQDREMTIELGFAWMTLPGGEEIGIVDVPGHRDFIGNMLAGIGSIDAVLLVIAADEGVMPQTREHLAILDLLQIKTGIIVLNKVDLVLDPEWLELIETDVRSAVSGTILAEAPLVRVSAKTRSGLDDLSQKLVKMLENCPQRPDLGRPRLPIDRVFSISGFGTIVTGTLLDGTFKIGDEVRVLPGDKVGRIRGLQNHKKKENSATSGTRTAINISGLAANEVIRGETVVLPGQYKETSRIDVSFKYLQDSTSPIKHGQEVKLFIGASESMASIRLLGMETLQPGNSGWIQLELQTPVVCVRGDRFILRRPSPSETLGGGEVVDPFPKRRYKRFSAETIKNLENLLKGSPGDILMQTSLKMGPSTIKELAKQSHLDEEQVESGLQELTDEGNLIVLNDGTRVIEANDLVMTKIYWETTSSQVMQIVKDFHARHPLKPGIPREELKSRLKMDATLFNPFLKRMGVNELIAESGLLVKVPNFQITLSAGQTELSKKLLKIFEQSPASPPSVKECINLVGEDVFNVLVELGELVQVSEEVVFRKSDFSNLTTRTKEFILKNGQITVAEGRDLFSTSRKYILALFEHLDEIGVTKREGDIRKLRS